MKIANESVVDYVAMKHKIEAVLWTIPFSLVNL